MPAIWPPIRIETLVFETGAAVPRAKLIPMAEFQGRLATKTSLEGAVVLRIGEASLLDPSMWGFADLIWMDLLRGVAELLDGRPAVLSFESDVRSLIMTPDKARGVVELTLTSTDDGAMLARAKAWAPALAAAVARGGSEFMASCQALGLQQAVSIKGFQLAHAELLRTVAQLPQERR